jgi:hypothetical protein
MAAVSMTAVAQAVCNARPILDLFPSGVLPHTRPPAGSASRTARSRHRRRRTHGSFARDSSQSAGNGWMRSGSGTRNLRTR